MSNKTAYEVIKIIYNLTKLDPVTLKTYIDPDINNYYMLFYNKCRVLRIRIIINSFFF